MIPNQHHDPSANQSVAAPFKRTCQLIRKGAIAEGYFICPCEATVFDEALDLCQECADDFKRMEPSKKIDAITLWIKYKEAMQGELNV